MFALLILLAVLPIQIAVSPSPIHRYQPATITVHTAPGASCTVSVYYRATRHYATSRSLHVRQLGQGVIRWTWTPETKKPGSAAITAACTNGSASSSAVATVTVV